MTRFALNTILRCRRKIAKAKHPARNVGVAKLVFEKCFLGVDDALVDEHEERYADNYDHWISMQQEDRCIDQHVSDIERVAADPNIPSVTRSLA